MAIKRVINEKNKDVLKNRKTLKQKFKNHLSNVQDTEAKKCLRALGKYVFKEKDTEN